MMNQQGTNHYSRLLEVEGEGNHLGMGTIERVGVLHERTVDEVGALLF